MARLLLLYVPVTDSPLDIKEILPKFDQTARSEQLQSIVLVATNLHIAYLNGSSAWVQLQNAVLCAVIYA